MVGQSQRDIKRRIKSVRTTQHITRAMQLVAAAKLRRAQTSAGMTRPFAEKLTAVLGRLLSAGGKPLRHPLLTAGAGERRAYLVISADRGLAGAYSTNVAAYAWELLEQETFAPQLLIMGRQGWEYLQKHDIGADARVLDCPDETDWHEASALAAILSDLFTAGQATEVYVVYTQFVNTLVHAPTVERLLPVTVTGAEGTRQDVTRGGQEDIIWEPSPSETLDLLLPRYVATKVHEMILEAKMSEMAARMAAMRNATENAEEMIENLTLHLNRARQAGITEEIIEIVGGANASTRAN